MALGSISFVLFAFVLTVLSSPVPIPQVSSTGPPIAIPSNPITFGGLTAPSLGGTFDDFKVAVPVQPDRAAPQAPHHNIVNRFLRHNSLPQKANVPATSGQGLRGSVGFGAFVGGNGCPAEVSCFKARDEPNVPANVEARAHPEDFIGGFGCPPGVDCFKARDEPNAPANVKARASLDDIIAGEAPCPAGVDCFKVTEKPSQGGDEA